MNIMSEKLVIYAIIAIGFLILVLWASNSYAESMQEMYNNEFISVIEVNDKLLPENTKFKCENGVLYKRRQVVRMYTGKAKLCKTVFIRRADREKNYTTSDLF